ncbi:MAG: hypothetical protein RQ748_00650 [Elusimicrobiales bacterium]|nr:hypothetical protein [Elusimicrobiales bacterium]
MRINGWIFTLPILVGCFSLGYSKDLPYISSEVFFSPTKRDLILVDLYSTEAGAIPRKAMLYALPLNTNTGKQLEASRIYDWSPDGQKVATIKVLDEGINFPIMKSKINLYSRNGEKLDFPGFGTSPGFLSADQILYCREFSDEGDITAPQVVMFDVKTGKRTVLYQFDPEFTFWTPDPADITEPVLKPIIMWAGYRGTIYKKGSRNQIYTYVIPLESTGKSPWKGAKLVMWEGNHTLSVYSPKATPTIEKR